MELTRRFRDYRHGETLAGIARSYLPAFPELEEIDFELDLLPSSSWHLGVTEQFRDPPRVRLRPARPTNPSLTYVIPHEFTHLLQRPLRLVPQGERACDLYAMARAGKTFLVAPSYLRVPREARREWRRWAVPAAHLAHEALAARAAGSRTYLVRWERALQGCFGVARSAIPKWETSQTSSPPEHAGSSGSPRAQVHGGRKGRFPRPSPEPPIGLKPRGSRAVRWRGRPSPP